MANSTNGECTINVQYGKDNQYVCVEHPALIKDSHKALNTLGGLENVEKVYEDPGKRLALSWRPDDVYAKCTYGDRIPVTNLLMKVCRRRSKKDGKEEFKIEVMGICETTYRFQAMTDFQFLPMILNKDNKYESIYENVVISRFKPMNEYMNAGVPLFLPPMMFSRSDRPCDFHYKQEMGHKPGYVNPEAARPPNLIGTVRQRRSIFTIFVNFGETVPTTPMEEAVKRTKSEFIDPGAEEVIRKLFEEKPLYLKVELEHRTGYRGEKLKMFLPAICFYWLDGPWRAQWNKFGYDPTKEVSAKIYQTIDFRIRALKPGQLDIKAKRDYMKLYNFKQTFNIQKQDVKIDLKALDDEETEETEEDQIEKELLYKFKPDKIPPHRMMYYPVNYVEIDEVQCLLHSNDGKEEKCTAQDGWCVHDFNNRCRDMMYAYLNRLLSQDDSVEHKVWRTKKKKRTIAKLAPGAEEGETVMEEEQSASIAASKDRHDKTNTKQKGRHQFLKRKSSKEQATVSDIVGAGDGEGMGLTSRVSEMEVVLEAGGDSAPHAGHGNVTEEQMEND